MEEAENKGNIFVKKGILTALAYFALYTAVVFIADHFMHLGGLASEIAMQGSIAFYAVMALCLYPVERLLIKPESAADRHMYFVSFVVSSLPLAHLNMLIGATIVDRFFYIDEWRHGATAGLQFGIYGIGLVVTFIAAVLARTVISVLRNFGK